MTEYIWTKDRMPEDCYRIRFEVFIREQRFSAETDERDFHCWHLLGIKDGRPFAAARIFSDDGRTWHIGRVAVLREYRGHGAGSALLHECERKAAELGARSFVLDAQVRAKHFYEQSGYRVCGEEHLDEYCPHVPMRKDAE